MSIADRRAFLKKSRTTWATKILLGIALALTISAMLQGRQTRKGQTVSVPNILPTALSQAKVVTRPAVLTQREVVTRPAVLPAAMEPQPSIEPLNLSAFRELTKGTLSELPTLQDLQNLKASEVHHLPLQLRQAGQRLGEIAQALHDNPNFASEGAAFYQDCFAREDLPAQIRGLCLADHRDLRLAHGDRPEWTPQEMQVPLEVIRLASLVPIANK